MPFYVTAWNWLAKNPVAQGIAAAIGVVLAFMFWLAAFHDPRIRKEAVRKANDRAEKQSDKIIEQAKEDSDERLQDAAEKRGAVPDDVSSTSGMSDGARSILFGSRSDSGGGGGH